MTQAAQVSSDLACERASLFFVTFAQAAQVTSCLAFKCASRHIYKYICGGVATSPPHTQIYNPATPSLKPREVTP
jgi:hypothetical protein